jgi:hypothetical protein
VFLEGESPSSAPGQLRHRRPPRNPAASHCLSTAQTGKNESPSPGCRQYRKTCRYWIVGWSTSFWKIIKKNNSKNMGICRFCVSNYINICNMVFWFGLYSNILLSIRPPCCRWHR